MENKIEKILELLLQSLQGAKDLASQELPGLIQEYATYLMVESFSFSGLAWMAGLAMVWAAVNKVFEREIEKAKSDKSRQYVGDIWLWRSLVLTIIGALLGVATANVLDEVKRVATFKLAPKAALIEHFRRAK